MLKLRCVSHLKLERFRVRCYPKGYLVYRFVASLLCLGDWVLKAHLCEGFYLASVLINVSLLLCSDWIKSCC